MFPATLYQLYPSILPAQTNPLPSPARTQTTLLFAQCVYLMFAGVYVAKEAVEHILLSAGHGHGHGRPSPSLPSAASTLASNASLNAAEGITRGLGLHGAGEMGNDGHHHHWGDERPEMLGCVFSSLVCFGEAYGFLVLVFHFSASCAGDLRCVSHNANTSNANDLVHRLCYPLGLVIMVLLSLLATSIAFEHHDVLVRGMCFRSSLLFMWFLSCPSFVFVSSVAPFRLLFISYSGWVRNGVYRLCF